MSKAHESDKPRPQLSAYQTSPGWVLFLTLVTATGCAATGDDPLAEGEEETGTEEETAELTPCADDQSVETPVVAAIANKEAFDDSSIALFAINQSGVLRDTGQRLGPIYLPQSIDVHPDGSEALVGWGTTAKTHGFTVVSLSAEAMTAEIAQHAELPGNATPRPLSYTGPDSVVISRIGTDADDLVALRRSGAGLEESESLPAPREFPKQVLPVAGQPGSNLFLDAPLNGDPGRVYELDDSGSLSLNPQAIAELDDAPRHAYANPVHPVAFFPTSNPNDDGTNPLNPTGRLMVVQQGDDGQWRRVDDYVLPELASLAVISPEGDHAIFVDEVRQRIPRDGGWVDVIEKWELYRVNFDDRGVPVEAEPPALEVAGSLIFDLKFGPRGSLVFSRIIGGDPEVYDVVSVAPAADGSYVECSAIRVEGRAELGVGMAD